MVFLPDYIGLNKGFCKAGINYPPFFIAFSHGYCRNVRNVFRPLPTVFFLYGHTKCTVIVKSRYISHETEKEPAFSANSLLKVMVGATGIEPVAPAV
jgi:hypothetical protein